MDDSGIQGQGSKTYGESEIVEEYIDMADLMEKRFRRTGYE